MIKIGIIGAAGYTAGELIRLLINHPEAELVFAQSASNAGNPVSDVHEGLIDETDLRFSTEADLSAVDLLFLCSGHGKSSQFWQAHEQPQDLRVIDLAQDFRDEHDGYVYGLPEYQRAKIAAAQKVANPGCFATCLQLGLLPLAKAGLLISDVHITAITGSTGAGVKPGATTHFSWRNNNLSVYKAFEHQHLLEINRTLHALQPSYAGLLNFIPMRGDFARGIFAAIYTPCRLGEDELNQLYADYYAAAPFTHVSSNPIDMKQVVNTNKCLLHVEKHGGQVLITSTIDNLLKGASGQAVQNMNLMFGLDESTGLHLKASAF